MHVCVVIDIYIFFTNRVVLYKFTQFYKFINIIKIINLINT